MTYIHPKPVLWCMSLIRCRVKRCMRCKKFSSTFPPTRTTSWKDLPTQKVTTAWRAPIAGATRGYNAGDDNLRLYPQVASGQVEIVLVRLTRSLERYTIASLRNHIIVFWSKRADIVFSPHITSYRYESDYEYSWLPFYSRSFCCRSLTADVSVWQSSKNLSDGQNS